MAYPLSTATNIPGNSTRRRETVCSVFVMPFVDVTVTAMVADVVGSFTAITLSLLKLETCGTRADTKLLCSVKLN